MIPFVDLRAIHQPLYSELVEAFTGVLDGNAFVLGPAVEQFERSFAAYVGRKHCVGLNSGTSALHLALKSYGIGPGDEVITTPHTFVATAWAISYCGARPVFADVEASTGNINSEQVRALVTPRTKAILPVDLYGNPAALTVLEEVAATNGLRLIDDACQAHGSRLSGRPVGSFGDVACFSFYPAKNLGAVGEGGAVVTDDDALADRLRMLRDHAQVGRHNHVEIGFNYRMEGVQGAVLGIKLHYLDSWNSARSHAAARYFELLSGLEGVRLPSVTPGGEPNWHLFVVRVASRERVIRSMQEMGVQTAVHYPVPVHLQPAYAHLGYRKGDFPEAEAFASSCLSLPMFPTITEGDQVRVAKSLAVAVGGAA
ncbi:MAG TPA: DegT/DnrJ/EryC1/StrS family aminotransferase [Acidimicrobiales bacterium]|nr:DegT/DnrJ/EryC1/StrS family aminotransferase [Acidimicrobiales bacterium]